MHHLFYVVNKKIKILQHNTIWIAINESLIFNLIKALIMILLIVELVFLIRPRSSYIYVDVKPEKYSLDGDVIRFDFIEQHTMLLTNFSELEIPLLDVEIDGNTYSWFDKLVFTKKQDTAYARVYLYAENNIERINFQKALLSNFQVYSNEVNINVCGLLTLSLDGCSARIRKDDNTEIEINSEKIVLQSAAIERRLDDCQKELEKYINEDGSVREEFSTEYDYCIRRINAWQQDGDWTLSANCLTPDECKKMEIDIYDLSLYPYVLQGSNLQSSNITGTGKIEMSYSPVTNKYTSRVQELSLVSSKNQINFEYDSETNKIVLNGFVNKAYLSGYSLFPNFWNWYVSNMYMAPLTLISTVFAGVSMMNSNRKKNK